jgi:hypothetical protein
MKNYLITLIVLLVPLAAVSLADRREQKKPREPDKSSIWMQRKLEHAQKILAGLTKVDFDTITENAQSMATLGYLEKWDNADRPDYKRELGHFEAINKDLIRQAQKKNLEGATLAYTQLTINCVKCHSIVRDAKK